MPLTRAAKESATTAGKLCRCIAAVKASAPKTRGRPALKGTTLKAQRRSAESRAIAICVAAVLQKKRGRTLKRFSCTGAKPMLQTQAPLKK